MSAYMIQLLKKLFVLNMDFIHKQMKNLEFQEKVERSWKNLKKTI